jgi:transposase-like protein
VSKERRRFDAKDKVKIIREHLIDKRPLSEVCQQYGIAPTQFYQWQKQFFEQGAAVFEPKKITVSKEYELENTVKKLTRKLAQKDEVIAEIMASHVELKKSLGED